MRESGLSRLQSVETTPYDLYFLIYKYLFASLKKAATYAKGDMIDISCGNKPYEGIFNVDRHFGCDIVQSSGNKVDLVCDSLNVSLQDESFDTALATQVIEHVANPQQLCFEAHRLLKPGGVFIVSGPMYWYLHEEPYDFYRFTKHGFKMLLETAGFEVLEIMPNGGKWALAGLVFMHSIQDTKFCTGLVIRAANQLFSWLDAKYYDDINTSNYVVVARK